jgi:hypothetical protein
VLVLLVVELRAELDAGAMQPRLRRGNTEFEKARGVAYGVPLERHECEQLRVCLSERPQRGLKSRIDPERMVLRRWVSDIGMVLRTRQPLDQLSIPSRPSQRVAAQIRCRHEQPRQHRTIHNADAVPASPKLQEGGSNEILSILSRLGKATRMPKDPIAMQIKQAAERRTIALKAEPPKALLAPHR